MLSLFEGLVTCDPKDVSPKPGVAERWEISPDARVYTFHLRHNAQLVPTASPSRLATSSNRIDRMLLPSVGSQYFPACFIP